MFLWISYFSMALRIPVARNYVVYNNEYTTLVSYFTDFRLSRKSIEKKGSFLWFELLIQIMDSSWLLHQAESTNHPRVDCLGLPVLRFQAKLQHQRRRLPCCVYVFHYYRFQAKDKCLCEYYELHGVFLTSKELIPFKLT